MRASAANQTSMAAGSTPFSRPISSRRAGKFYGMAGPSFRRRKVATGSRGGMGMDIAVLGVDFGKNVCSVVGWMGPVRS
jgi:hypothetical protein